MPVALVSAIVLPFDKRCSAQVLQSDFALIMNSVLTNKQEPHKIA